jgi:outer membrane biosynthesis protein TonB
MEQSKYPTNDQEEKMCKKHQILIAVALVALVASGLACGLPTPTVTTRPTVTPYVPATAEPQDAPTPESPTDVPEATEAVEATEPPPPTEEEAPPPTDTPQPSDTPTPAPPTPVPPTSAPSATLEPTATHTPETAAPLDFEPPQYVDSWEKKGDTNTVALRVNIVGGAPPFTISHGPTIQGTTSDRTYLIEFDWSSCKSAMVQSITVESSDGQTVKKDYFIPVELMPWCGTVTP